MRKGHWVALSVLLGAMVMVLAWTSPAQSQRVQQEEPGLVPRIAKQAKMPEADVNRMLQALGPAVKAELAAGKQVNLPGLGTFRVVRIPEHRDMIVGGRNGGTPIVVPGVNNVEFLPEGTLSGAANAPTAIPADVVPPFQYNIIPGQTPGQKAGRNRVPTIRSP